MLKPQKKAWFESKSGTGKKSLAFLLELFNALKRQLKPEKTTSNKKERLNVSSLVKLIQLLVVDIP
jgi:superfamily II DNA/RNA helicase